jgi:hypothetical protein
MSLKRHFIGLLLQVDASPALSQHEENIVRKDVYT